MSEIVATDSLLSFDATQWVEQFLSQENFQKAWEKVAKNQGCPGVDEETIEAFATDWMTHLSQLQASVANSTYQPQPCKQVLIPKGTGKWRELRIPTVRDRIVQQALLNILAPIAEEKFSAVSFAYRPNLSYINAVEQVAHWRDLGYNWVLDADIVQFFDSINQSRLLSEVRKYCNHSGVLWLIKAWISSGVQTRDGLLRQDKGIPQGAVISPLLANIYLNEFDHYFASSDLRLIRYADDFLVLAATQARIFEAYREVYQILRSLDLELHGDKTHITNFQQGFCFLGHGFLENAIFPIDAPKKNTQKKKLEPEIVPSVAETPESELPHSFIWNKEMATLYLTEPGTSVYKEYQRFVVHISNSKNKKIEVLIREVERILVFGNIQLTTQVISACLQEKIMVLFLNSSGNYKGHLWSLESVHLGNELIQIEQHKNKNFQLSVSQNIVRGKLLNSKQLLLRLNRKRKLPTVSKAISGLTLDLSAVDLVDNVDSLRGYEGIGAARYFPAFGQLITNPNFSFSQRFRQPPTDPVNALLSFGYTLLFNNVVSLIIAEGLSPYFGNFHYGEDKKPYLAFDLMEEFRSPIVDSFVIRIINQHLLGQEDFESVAQNGGVYLTSSSRRIFLEQFEKRMNEKITHPDLQSPVSYRQAIQLQIRRYKQSLLQGRTYEPFLRAA